MGCLQAVCLKDLRKGLFRYGLRCQAVIDKAMGRRADNPDVYESTDAFILGMMGGKGGRLSGNVMTSMSSYMGHNKNFVNRMAMENVIRETEAEYNAAPAASAEKANLRMKLLNLRSQLREMRSEEARAYDNFSLEDKQNIRKLDQQLARMRDMLKSKKDGAGIKLNKEQLDQLRKGLTPLGRSVQKSRTSTHLQTQLSLK